MRKGQFIERQISDYICRAAAAYPVVTICGPRQSGKTTLARHLFPDYDYVSMESPDAIAAFELDPLAFLQQHKAPCIFDEIQNTPKLLSYLQGIIDEQNSPGMYILTGSRQMELQQSITQSLAGRTAIIDLLPLSLAELNKAGVQLSRDQALFYGGLPRVHANKIAPDMAYPDYLRTYVERDARQIVNVRNLKAFDTFIRLLAARVGQVINYTSLANDVGVSSTTIKEWISILEASYIIFTLHPYYKNYGKRLTKSPKIYFTEPGLVTSLLGIREPAHISRDPLIGNMFENLIVAELLKAQLNLGQRPDLFFYRDSNGFEIDIILEQQRLPKPIEIKAALTFSPALTKNLRSFAELVPDALEPALIYSGAPMGTPQGVKVLSYNQVSELI